MKFNPLSKDIWTDKRQPNRLEALAISLVLTFVMVPLMFLVPVILHRANQKPASNVTLDEQTGELIHGQER